MQLRRQLRRLPLLLPALASALAPMLALALERLPAGADEVGSGVRLLADATDNERGSRESTSPKGRPALRQRYADVNGGERERRAPPPELPAAQAAEHFRQGQRLEQDGRVRDAMGAYLSAARGGHGPAQKRLGILYGRGSVEVPRDYAESIQWYERARRSGEDVPEPLQFSSPRAGH